jgi:hypothetical protein
MRLLLLNVVGVGALAAIWACAEKPPAVAHAPAAVSAESRAVPAIAIEAQQGYSDPSRRLVDCAASFPAYDVRTDLYEVSPGVTRRCPL